MSVVSLGVLIALLSTNQPAAPSRPIDIQAVSFMAGHWVGTGTDISEEVWLPPAADAMLGMWRWARDGRSRLYELLVVAKEGDSVVLRLRHFRPDLVALEEKDKPFVLPLISVREREAVFEGVASDGGPLRITYRRPSPDRLEASVEKTGSKQEYVYRRKQ